ncbi:MAG: ATP-grasp domain-containing protein [Halieaceae bacterium]|nr:ATP-grasp domain-containing protein [Halieaceae bacterium]
MNLRLGIVGGGQLGMYLSQAAGRLGIDSCVLTEEADAPAASFATQLIVGDPGDAATLEALIDASDVITFDKEDIPNEALMQLRLAAQQRRIEIRPQAETLFLLKDKGQQKTWLTENRFPTLPFKLLQGNLGKSEREPLAAQFGLPLVQKARCGGYDGRGVQIISDLDQLWDTPSLVEPFLENAPEIAVLLARDVEGNTQAWPTFGMDFDPHLNSVTTVYTPANISSSLAAEAVDLGVRIVSALGGIGVFAIEMFIDGDGALQVNEISPRVHNSGHLTMEASPVSQFEQHVRAVCGLTLEDVSATQPAAMSNILYREAFRKACPAQPVAQGGENADVTLHWYGKPPGRPGRKMGHITALAEDSEEAVRLAREALENLADSETEAA